MLLRRDRRLGLPADGNFLDVGEERRELVEFARRERVVLVVVALGAAQREAEPRRREVAHAVRRIFGRVFLRLAAAFLRRLQQPIVARRDLLLIRRVRQQVAGDLLDREFGERLVLVERIDHPIAVHPHAPIVVAVIARGISVTDHVEPVDRHAFAEMLRREQPIYHLLIRRSPFSARIIPRKRIDLFRRRRQPGQIERQPPNQRPRVGFRRRRQTLLLQPRENKAIDVVAHPRRVLHCRQLVLRRRDQRPVFLILRALLDPIVDQLDFVLGHHLHRLRRRHLFVGVVRDDAAKDLAHQRLARDDHALVGALLVIEP